MKARFAALATLIAVTVYADRANGFNLIGAGGASCGTWTAERAQQNSTHHYAYEQWVLGFIGGAAYESSDTALDPLRNLDAQAVWAWVDNYCRANPLNNIVYGAEAFIAQHPR